MIEFIYKGGKYLVLEGLLVNVAPLLQRSLSLWSEQSCVPALGCFGMVGQRNSRAHRAMWGGEQPHVVQRCSRSK